VSNRRRPRNRGIQTSGTTESTARATSSPGGPGLKATARSPADALAMIPYLLGFEPIDSVVAVALEGPRRRFGAVLRADLVETDDAAALADYLVRVVEAHGIESVLLAVYTGRRDLADALVPRLADALEAVGVSVVEGLVTDRRRWWSYRCDGRDCCPPEGTPFDPSTSPMAAHAVVAGMAKAPDRESLRAQFAPRSDAVRRGIGDRVRRLLADAEERCEREEEQELDEAAAGADEMADAVVSALGCELDADDMAWLLALAQDIDARDAAWWLMSRADATMHFELWRQVMQVAPDDLMPPAGSLCGFAGWLAGKGALAAFAVERVAEVAPQYSMMRLLRDVIDSSLSPDVWETRPSFRGRGPG
jgi:hypothetical protein